MNFVSGNSVTRVYKGTSDNSVGSILVVFIFSRERNINIFFIFV